MTNKIEVGKIEIDRNKCIGAAVCVSIDPKTFEIDSENKAVTKKEEIADSKTVVLAAQSCPTQAISVFDGKGKKIY